MKRSISESAREVSVLLALTARQLLSLSLVIASYFACDEVQLSVGWTNSQTHISCQHQVFTTWGLVGSTNIGWTYIVKLIPAVHAQN